MAEKLVGELPIPVTVALTDWVPCVFPRAHVTAAAPLGPVTTELFESVPPPAVTVQLTVTPCTPAPSEVVTAIVSGVESV
jgi:hypothetical protein